MEHGAKAAKAFSSLIRQTAPKDGKPGKNRSLVVATTATQPVILVSAKPPTGALGELRSMSKKLGALTPVAISQVVFEGGEVKAKVFKAANEAAVKKAFLGYYKTYKVAPPSLKLTLVQPDEWDPVEFAEDPEDTGDAEDDETDDEEDAAETASQEDQDDADEEEEEEEDEAADAAKTSTDAAAGYQKQIVAMVERFKRVSAAVGADPNAAKLLQAAKLKLGEANTNLKSQSFDAVTAALSVANNALVRALTLKAAAATTGAGMSAAPAAEPAPPSDGEDEDDALETPPPFGEAVKKKLASLKRVFTPSKEFPPEPSTKELTARQTVITAVSQPGGSADANDVALVGKELEKLPSRLLKLLETSGMKVTACRGSVTDHMSELAGVQPRGWPDGMTWDSVPGCYSQTTKEIVVATKGHASGAAEVPKTGDGHGSANLTLHEAGHAINLSQTPMLAKAAEFTSARTPDLEGITAYEKQTGDAGLDETFAESCARYFSGDPASAESTPNIHKYWNKNKFLKGLA